MKIYRLPWVRFARYNEVLRGSTRLSRFVFDKKAKEPKPNYFRGRSSPGDDISLFETSSISQRIAWKIGAKINPGGSLSGRCVVKARELGSLKLPGTDSKSRLKSHRAPFSAYRQTFCDRWWHANVSGMPKDEEEYKDLLLQICDIATFIRK